MQVCTQRARGRRRGRCKGDGKAKSEADAETRLRDLTSSELSELREYLCCVVPAPRRDIDTSHFCSLQTRLYDDSEVSCTPESDPLVDVGLTFFAVDDSAEYTTDEDKPFPDDLPRSQVMRVRRGWTGKGAGRGAYMLGS